MALPNRHARRAAPLPNPFAPSSPGYSERNEVHPADIGEGMMRVDIGKPAGLVRDILRNTPQAS